MYQTVWLREFRLIFGGSTPATAAVLAVYMGGLGFGGLWFGRKSERTVRLLRLYAALEFGIGATAALTPFLLEWVRTAYGWTGGVLTLGSAGASLAQVGLAVLVLGVPCFLAGGTLPPAVQWIVTNDDRQRGSLGVIYGCNALGAVAGVLWSTFWALEHWGTRATLWWAAGLQVFLGILAWRVSRGEETPAVRDLPAGDVAGPESAAAPGVVSATRWVSSKARPEGEREHARFVYGAAAVTGFTFFLVELVWYRMLSPLLGGSVYCFGLILAQVLLGIGIGAGLYRGLLASRPGAVNLGALATISAMQAAAVAIPLALGDRMAVMAYHWQQWRSLGFGGLLAGWSFTVGLAVLLPSVLGGIQFPLLVGLLGTGRKEAARQVGGAYAANTVGAIAGSLIGGFVLLPWLTAPGCWRLVVALGLGLAFAALLRCERPWSPWAMFGTLLMSGAAVSMAFHSRGPTAVWRHTSIGYGVVRAMPTTPSETENQMRSQRRQLAREYEGRESSIAVMRGDEGWALFSNGKADGSAISDGGTQVMLGLVSAMQHPEPKSAFVIGLGTGTSAGWLADVPGMERVDVVELEPRVVDVARDFFGPVNRDALAKTNLHVTVGDAREVLWVTDRTYDLIVSEPPNPYRAGVANLFTREYYEAVRRRLAPGGIFSQWLQGYQLSVESVQVVYATLLSVFPYVETWMTQGSDLLFVGHLEAPAYPIERLRDRLELPLFQEALARAWMGRTVDDFVARHFAGTATARRLAEGARVPNTDDRNVLEYGLARTQMGQAGFFYQDLLVASVAEGDDQPRHLRASIDQARLMEARFHLFAIEGEMKDTPSGLSEERAKRAQAILAWANARYADVLALWRGPVISPAEQLMLTVSVGRAGTPEQAKPILAAIEANWPVDAWVAAALLAHRAGADDRAVGHLGEAFRAMEIQPWVHSRSLDSVVELSAMLVAARPQDAERLLEMWRTPLSVGQLAPSVPNAWYRLALRLPVAKRIEVLDAIGPEHPWNREFLEFKKSTLEAAGHPLAAEARREWEKLVEEEGRALAEVLPPKPGTPAEGVR
ncbi:MAG: fused MFS/spermidine synthase [Verrucomicrobiales bacterium]|nr:fused MFS/spermidine synthase [Verrucomicrobiales bacterium]